MRHEDLAYFLINNEISVEEGMELTQQSLELDPGNLGFLWTKGSGYYKLGDLEKSLQLLLEVDLNYPYFNNNLKQQIQVVEQALGIPEAWFEPLQKLGYTTIKKIKEVEDILLK